MNELILLVVAAINTLFETRAADVQRCSGQLNKKVATGMLLADAYGSALPVPDDAARLGKRAQNAGEDRAGRAE